MNIKSWLVIVFQTLYSLCSLLFSHPYRHIVWFVSTCQWNATTAGGICITMNFNEYLPSSSVDLDNFTLHINVVEYCPPPTHQPTPNTDMLMSTTLTMHGISGKPEWSLRFSHKMKLQTAPWRFWGALTFCECCPVAACNKVTCSTDHGLVKLSQGCLWGGGKFTLWTEARTTSNFNNLLLSHGLTLADLKEFRKVKVGLKDRVQGQNWRELKEISWK